MIFNINEASGYIENSYLIEDMYTKPYGYAVALVENARSDYKMFRALLNADAREIHMMGGGYVDESAIIALQEGVLANIWNKIKEFFKKLIQKIKSIFHVFLSKIHNIFMSDKQMAKKYGKEILRKSNIGNLEVKWRNVKHDPLKYNMLHSDGNVDTAVVSGGWSAAYKDSADDREKFFIDQMNSRNSGMKVTDMDDIDENMMEYFLDDEEELQIKDIKGLGGARGIINYIETCEKLEREIQKKSKNSERALDKLVRELERKANEANKSKNEAAILEYAYILEAMSPEEYEQFERDMQSNYEFLTKMVDKTNEEYERYKLTLKDAHRFFAASNDIEQALMWQNTIDKLENDPYYNNLKALRNNLDNIYNDYQRMADSNDQRAADETRETILETIKKEQELNDALQRLAKHKQKEAEKLARQVERERKAAEQEAARQRNAEKKRKKEEEAKMLANMGVYYNKATGQYESIAKETEEQKTKISLKRPEGYKANRTPKTPKSSSGGSGSGSNPPSTPSGGSGSGSGSGSGAPAPSAPSTPDPAANNGKTEVQIANETYEMSLSYQTVTLRENKIVLDAVKEQYKYYKAAFMKMISANNNKLKEATYLDAVAECVMDEVDEYFSMV